MAPAAKHHPHSRTQGGTDIKFTAANWLLRVAATDYYVAGHNASYRIVSDIIHTSKRVCPCHALASDQQQENAVPSENTAATNLTVRYRPDRIGREAGPALGTCFARQVDSQRTQLTFTLPCPSSTYAAASTVCGTHQLPTLFLARG
ncbi:unnamed protein product [Phytophthora fragariaefolia]|uniref:Unnamed protein product n=1 Tax=Phytophthora fragariaefolia TaxID=1490495 RepID=A0A9W6X322_9STRA|nr:unnamed protein product [Phytophthora fragariaefolia]